MTNFQFKLFFCVLTGMGQEQVTASDGGEGDEAGEDHLNKHSNIIFCIKNIHKNTINH